MRPGGGPIENLAESLAKSKLCSGNKEAIRKSLLHSSLGLVRVLLDSKLASGESLLLVVDQFEELFRFDREQKQTDSGHNVEIFIASLLEAADRSSAPAYVVITMRSDFIGYCTQFCGLPEVLNRSQYLIPRLTREQLRDAIEKPIRLADARVSPPLVEELLNQQGEQVVDLPVIQHALRRTFQKWKKIGGKGDLGLEHYKLAGRLSDALNDHAEELLAEVDEPCAEKVFRCLTTVEGGQKVRRPTSLKRIYKIVGANTEEDRGKVRNVVKTFSARKESLLLWSGEKLSDESVIDISHEKLIELWKKLNAWVDDETKATEWYDSACKDVLRKRENEAGRWREGQLARGLSYVAQGYWNEEWAKRLPNANVSFGDVQKFLADNEEEQRAENEKEQARREREVTAEREAKQNAQAREGAERQAKEDALARHAAETKARKDAEARELAERNAKKNAEARERAERQAKADAEALAKAESAAKVEAMAREDAERRARFEAEARAIAESSAKVEATAREHAEREAKESAQARSRLLTVLIMLVLIAASIVTWLMYSVSKHKANEDKLALRVQQQDKETARKLKEQAQLEENRRINLTKDLEVLLAAGNAKTKDVEALQKQIRDLQAKSEANAQAASSPNARNALSEALDRAAKAEDRALRAEKERDQLAATLKGGSTSASELEAARTRAVKAEQERDQLRTELGTVKKQLKDAQDALNALGLKAVLKSMDKAVESATTIQGNFNSKYGSSETESGTFYSRRRGGKFDFAIAYTSPVKKRVLWVDGKMTTITDTKTSSLIKRKLDVVSQGLLDTLMGIGITTPTGEMLKYFDATFAGMEQIDDLLTAKLRLTANDASAPSVTNASKAVTLWIDPVRGFAVKIDSLDWSYKHTLVSYSQILVNQELPPGVFELPPKSH
jgi:outer membrane lipoprotein-sorting protein